MSDGAVFEVVCTDCSWDAVYPTRETAGHARRVHEAETGHEAAVGRVA